MKNYLISLLCVSTLIAGTYDDPYVLEKVKDNVVVEQDQFMDGTFLEIKRFDSLQFNCGTLSRDSENNFQKIVDTINRYTEQKKNIAIQVIGHSSVKTDMYDKVNADEKLYVESLQESKKFAHSIAKKLEDNNISREILSVEYRASEDPSHTNTTNESINLSNRVMIIMYVLAAKDKDSDNDGIFDSKDECSNTPDGVNVDEKGCPFDSDNDIVLDYIDECLDTPMGVAVDDKGCPFDSDEDSVLDYKDQCLDTKQGLKVDADGCPISRELKLLFKTKSSKISSAVYSQVIDFARFLQNNPTYKAQVIGHTDSVGKAGENMKLSFDRANSVISALKNEGIKIERLEAIGRGELSPLETNRTEAGRAKNRRIEVKLFN